MGGDLDHNDDQALQDEGATDGDQHAGNLILDQRAEAESEEAQQDGGQEDLRDHGARLARTDVTEPPMPEFHGSPMAKTATKEMTAMITHQMAVVITLAPRTRLR